MLLSTLSRRYTAAFFISWTSLSTTDYCTTAIQLKPEKHTYNQHQITINHDAECSQLPEMAKNIVCRCCFESLKSTEGLKSILQKTGLNSHIACRSLQEKDNSPKALPLHQHHSCFYLGLAICHVGLAIKVQLSPTNGLIYSSY